MPPLILPPPNIRPWKPIIAHVPAPPKAEANPDLKRYKEAKAEWKDSTPEYRHKNPRPETWIPKTIVDTDYKLPTVYEREHRRLEYQTILEEIKERIPPEYYEHFRQKYAKPHNFEAEGPDLTGAIDGYKPGMFQHPRFMEKDHSKYHALPRKMFPEEEKLYKLQETDHVKDSLDILEDNGMDYEERMWLSKHKTAEKKVEDENVMREEVFRTTHWIDWNSDKDEMSEMGDEQLDSDGPSPAEIRPVSRELIPPDNIEGQTQSPLEAVNHGKSIATVPGTTITPITKTGLGPALVNSTMGLAFGASLIGAVYGLWKLFKGPGKHSRSTSDISENKSTSAKSSPRHKTREIRSWDLEEHR
jgi:hypothetical protein